MKTWVITLSISVFCFLLFISLLWFPYECYSLQFYNKDIIEGDDSLLPYSTNIDREVEMIPEPEPDEWMGQVAVVKLNDLANTNFWDHSLSTGCNFSCRVSGYNNYYEWIGENLYRGKTCDLESAYRLWNESPTHKQVLDHEYTNEVIRQQRNNDYCYIVLLRVVVR